MADKLESSKTGDTVPTHENAAVPSGEYETVSPAGKYTVVARRYRPKTFTELVGQQTVAHALLSAIESNRVGHAYLFTGARGVGKTSTARIFAKALNAAEEANGKFDPHSEIALAIDSGEDMDVIEIDGASNRGIDEIRQLRANAAVRPSRSRYKIYIIDEVHMLTTQAFNALLKTLEEPPGHVKFIFCTTDPEKIPITVLSRCQRFDFPPVHTDQILERLKFICENEGTKADEAALRLIARRAAGSMRDSQSLLEQLLSFGGNEIHVESVHAMLGTADETRLASFASRMIERDAAGALRELDAASAEGVDVGQLAEQLLGYLRDMMAVSVGSPADLMRTANPNSYDQLVQWGKAWGTMTLLSALQLLDESIVRMRHSVQSRILLEIALVQICNLQDLQSLVDLVKAFDHGSAAPPPRAVSPAIAATPATSNNASPPPKPTAPVSEELKKKDELTATISPTTIASPTSATALSPLNDSATNEASPAYSAASAQESSSGSSHENSQANVTANAVRPEKTPVSENAPLATSVESKPLQTDTAESTTEPLKLLRIAAGKLGGLVEQCAEMVVRTEALDGTHWRVFLAREGGFALGYFQSPENAKRLGESLFSTVGRNIALEYVLTNEPAPDLKVEPSVSPKAIPESSGPSVPQSQLIRKAMVNDLVKLFMDVFEGQIVRVDAASALVARPNMIDSPNPNEQSPQPTMAHQEAGHMNDQDSD